MALVARAHPDPSEVVRGASEADLTGLGKHLGFPVPNELADWLRVCRGSTAGPGGLFGVGNAADGLNMNSHLRWFPGWLDRGWIPVAGDGTGNYYILDALERGHPVGFVEPSETVSEVQYFVASGLEVFLRELLVHEISRNRWPFDRDYVGRVDPALLVLEPLPWG